MSGDKKPLRDLPSCVCGGRPKIERFCGWWHIECGECHRYPAERFGSVRVWGWNTRKEAIDAWERCAKDGSLMGKDSEEADKGSSTLERVIEQQTEHNNRVMRNTINFITEGMEE